MKERNLQTLILSEYYSAILYLDRVAFLLSKIHHPKKEIDECLKRFYLQILNFFNSQFTIPPLLDFENLSEKNLYSEIKKICDLSLMALNLPLSDDFNNKVFIPLINILYENAHHLHSICLENNYIQIDFPRTQILKSREMGPLPLFYLDPNDLLKTHKTPIHSLIELRNNRYEEYLSKGLEAISYKQYKKAVDFLSNSLNFKETAEVFSLLGWLHSLLNNLELAKEYCKKAINLDPDFGPPYNDLGLIIMEEGDLKGSLKLFSQAKLAPKYQNREYPYINSGRIYMFLKKYDLALEELRIALALVPSHPNLQNTIQNLLKIVPLPKLCQSKELN